MYKKASRLKLTYKTRVGNVSTDQLWGLKIGDLKEAIKTAQEDLKKYNAVDDDLDFLEDAGGKTTEEKLAAEAAKLRFDILKDVFLTRRDEANQQTADFKKKQELDHLRAILAEKKEDDLRKMSAEDLEKLIKEKEGAA